MEAQERTIALRVQQALVEHERQHSAVLHEEVKKSQQLELGLLQATNKLQELCDSLPPATRDPHTEPCNPVFTRFPARRAQSSCGCEWIQRKKSTHLGATASAPSLGKEQPADDVRLF